MHFQNLDTAPLSFEEELGVRSLDRKESRRYFFVAGFFQIIIKRLDKIIACAIFEVCFDVQ
jgi:hypothetical protein